MGKGDHYRPVDKKKFNENFESIFGPRKIKTWNPGEDDEVGGEQGNGVGNFLRWAHQQLVHRKLKLLWNKRQEEIQDGNQAESPGGRTTTDYSPTTGGGPADAEVSGDSGDPGGQDSGSSNTGSGASVEVN
jgi:hypothetical protein